MVADRPATIEEATSETMTETVGMGDSGGMGESGGYGFRLVVAPAAGRVRHLPPTRFHDGHEWVTAGQAVALVEQGSAGVEVCSPVDGRVAGILVRDGEPVLPGQPVVWVHEGLVPPATSEEDAR
jgi:biotin carboxyl carrier protein